MLDRSMLSRRWSLAVVLAALATAVIVGFAPLVATSECVASSSGGAGHVDEAAEVSCSSGSRSLVANEGAGVLVVLAIPVAVAALPLIVPTRRAALSAAIPLTVAMVLGAMSVGILLVPTVVLAWLAVRFDWPPARPATSAPVTG
jgi:hypothetical protein